MVRSLLTDPRRPRGSGLANLAERLTAVGGGLTAAVDGAHFLVTAAVPVSERSPASSLTASRPQ
jgi:signal transduction histidine kinase